MILKQNLTKKIVGWINLELVRLLQRALLKAVIESSCPPQNAGNFLHSWVSVCSPLIKGLCSSEFVCCFLYLLYGQYRVTKHFSVINMFSSARSTKKTAREHKHTIPPRELAWNKAVSDFNRCAYCDNGNTYFRGVYTRTREQNINSYAEDTE